MAFASRKKVTNSLSTRHTAFNVQLTSFYKSSSVIVLSSVGSKRMASSSSPPVDLKDASLWKSLPFINGEFKSGSWETFTVYNPSTGKEIGKIPDLTISETQEAIQSASEAFKSWSQTTSKERSDLLRKLFGLLMENSEDLAKIITIENGKPLAEAKGEITYGAGFIDWFAGEALRDYGDIIPSAIPGLRNLVIKQPIGVAGILTPFNFPHAMITRKLGPALAAGCTTVIKAPSETPYSALAIAELCKRAGIPKGVVNILTTDKHIKEVGKEICENSNVRKVSFTGSTAVGKLLMSQSASTLKKLSFELGGNAPFIVFDDADLEAAVDGAITCKFRHSGQTCVCANRILVQSTIYPEFASRFAEKVGKMKVGDGFEEDTQLGPVIHQRGLDKVQRHVEDAKAKGASVLVGGHRITELEGTFYAPTVLCDVSLEAQLSDEETFGPVAGLFKFETEEDAIRIANNTEVGLAGYFYSRDVGRIWRVAEALEVGMVGVNTGLISQIQIPFGGVKESGFGREGSKYGMHEYQIMKFIAMGGLDS